MTTLFDSTVNRDICTRIRKLNPSSKPVWGKMNVEQMLAHLYLSLQVNFGEIELKRSMLGISFLRSISRRILLGRKPFPRHLPADKKLLVKEAPGFSELVGKVEHAIRMYIEKGHAVLSTNPHNILGKISPEESAFISFKHIDHHLRQFGV